MKVDLSKFKLKHKTDKIATLIHPEGHEFRVAISALHPENRKNLEKLQMADGGEVAENDENKPLEVEEEKPSKLEYEPIKPKHPIEYEKLADGGQAGASSGSASQSDSSKQAPEEKIQQGPGPANTQPVEYAPIKSNLARGGEIRQSNPKLEESKKLPPKPQLPHYDQGGQVNPKPSPEPQGQWAARGADPDKRKAVADSLAKAFGNKKAQGGEIERDASPSPSPSPDNETLGSKIGYPGADKTVKKPRYADGGEAESNDIPYDKLIPQEQAANAPYVMPGQEQTSTPQASPNQQQPMPEQQPPAQQAASAIPPNPADNYDLMHGAALEQKGMQEQANAESRAADAQAAQLRVQGQAQYDLQQSYQDKLNEINTERENTVQDYKNQHIDPNRYMGNMNLGQRILTSMAIGLGGVGGAMTHQENPALKFLNQQIDRDIEQQKSELGKRQTLLQSNLEHYKNLQDATMMSKLQMGDYAKTQLDKLAAQSQSPIIQARALQMKGQLEQQMAPIAHQLAMKQMLMGAQPGSIQEDPAQLISMNVPPDKQKEVAKEVDDAKEITRNKDKLLRNFAEADRENTVLKTGAGKLREPGAVKELKALILPQFKNIDGTVREYAAEQAFNNFIPAPGDAPSTVEHKRRALMDWMESKQGGSLAKTYGIDLQKFAATNSMGGSSQAAGAGQTKTLNGNKYFKVPGGWKKVQ